MFEIRRAENGDIVLSGRLDASQAQRARDFLGTITESCAVDFSDLEYVSSLGLGVLLEAQRRLTETGHALKLTRLNDHLQNIFKLAGFYTIFEVE